MRNESYAILGIESAYCTGAVGGYDNRTITVEEKTGCMNKFFLLIVKGTGQPGNLFRFEPVGDRESQLILFYHLCRVLYAVNRCSQHTYIQLFKIVGIFLKVSQLLTTKGSPSAAVKKNDPPGIGEFVWKFERIPRD